MFFFLQNDNTICIDNKNIKNLLIRKMFYFLTKHYPMLETTNSQECESSSTHTLITSTPQSKCVYFFHK